MLKKTHTLWAHHIQAALHSANSLCAKPLATLMTILVIAITLSLPTLLSVFINNINQLTDNWQQTGSISLYLKPNVGVSDQQRLVQEIKAMEGVGQVSLKSAAEGLAELMQQEGMQDIMHYLPENPLPAVIEVRPSLLMAAPAKLDLLSRSLQKLQEVDQVKLDMSWISRLHAILNFASNATKALMGLLALAVILIIANTLRSAVQNRREEIQILKLIGASEAFILRPFLYSGVWYGLAGAVLTLFLVNIIMLSVGLAINNVISEYNMHYLPIGMSMEQILILLIFSIILGWLAARLSVKRQLSIIEPYN